MKLLTSLVRCYSGAFALSIFLVHASFSLQVQPASGVNAEGDTWQVPLSHNLMPHFEGANGHNFLYVDGRPFTVLAVEIPWWDLLYGHYKETETVYDALYPAAEKIGLNALRVPTKWSMVEPEKGVYDFSYVDHAKSMAEKHHLKLVLNWFGHYASGDGTIYGNLTGELYVPMYIVNEEKTYPRAVDGNGVVHHNAASYDYEPIIDREIAAFRAFMQHIKQVDSQTHIIVMIQVENEIAVFGVDRNNPAMWRDHSLVASKRFADNSFTDELKFSAWDLSYNWIRRITDAGAEVYPIPFFHNYVGGKIADLDGRGCAGRRCTNLSQELPQHFVHRCELIFLCGLATRLQLRARVGRDSRRTQGAAGALSRRPQRAGHYGDQQRRESDYVSTCVYRSRRIRGPDFCTWALTVSFPESNQPYVLSDGTLANGAYALRDTYSSLAKALPQISYYATTDKLKVFMSRSPGQRFSTTEPVGGFPVTVTGENNGEAIVIHPAGHEFLLVGYRANVSFTDPTFQWPAMKQIRVERVVWAGDHWNQDGAPNYGVDQSKKTLNIDLGVPQAILVSW